MNTTKTRAITRLVAPCGILALLCLIGISSGTTTSEQREEASQSDIDRVQEKTGNLRVNGEDAKSSTKHRALNIVYPNTGGPDAVPLQNKFPQLVEVGGLGCSGSMVAEDVVLTAAHCLGSYVKVRSDRNSGGMIRREVIHRINHEQYSSTGKGPRRYDISLLKIKKVDGIIPLKLNGDATFPQAGDQVMAVGRKHADLLGFLPRSTAQGIEMDVLDEQDCRWNMHNRATDADTEICAAGGEMEFREYYWPWNPNTKYSKKMFERGSCGGDSGGPVVRMDDTTTIVGVIAGGNPETVFLYPFCLTTAEIYARVSTFKPWIEKWICNLTTETKPDFC